MTTHAERLAELDRLVQLSIHATPGPWTLLSPSAEERVILDVATGARLVLTPDPQMTDDFEPNAEFIVAARTAVPELARKVRGMLIVHQPVSETGEPPICRTCSMVWPCDTARICGVTE